MRDTFVRTLVSLAESDPRIFLITGDLGFGVLDQYASQLPRQYLNAGVAEQNMTGVATGLALGGRIVFTYSIANFPTLRCLEQIRNDACYHAANVKIVSVGGGLSYGALGMSHHATEDLAILRSLPNMTVMSPGDEWEVAEATRAMVSRPGPCYLRLDKTTASNLAPDNATFGVGRARELRSGDCLTVMATGGIVSLALRAVDRLADSGPRVRLLSMHTVKPLDHEAVIRACRETGGILTVEEHTLAGGLGGAVAEVCLDAGITPRAFRRLGLNDCFTSVVGSQDYLRKQYYLSEEAIYESINALVNRIA